MFVVGECTSEPEIIYCLPWKVYCCSWPSHLMPENFVPPSAFWGVFCFDFLFCFFYSFLFFGQLRPLVQSFMVWLTQTPQKILTKSPKVTKIWIISFRCKVTWFTTAQFPMSCLFYVVYILSTKRRTRVFDRSAAVAFVIQHSQEWKIWREKTYTKNIGSVYYCSNMTHSNALSRYATDFTRGVIETFQNSYFVKYLLEIASKFHF